MSANQVSGSYYFPSSILTDTIYEYLLTTNFFPMLPILPTDTIF